MSLERSSPAYSEFPVKLENSILHKVIEADGILVNLTQLVEQYEPTFNSELSLQFIQVKQQELVNKVRSALSELSSLCLQIVNEKLPNWDVQQRLAANGENISLPNTFKTLINECEEIAQLLLRCRKQLKNAMELTSSVFGAQAGQDEMEKLLRNIDQLIRYLIISTVVVKDQPPQILKVDTFFSATLTILVGRYFNKYSALPQVEVGIVSQELAILYKPSEKLISLGEIKNNQGTMSYDDKGHLSLNLNKLKLLSINRAKGKKQDGNVTDEKLCIYFQCNFSNGEKKVVFSLPIVAIKHGCQKPSASATITWENAFREQKGLQSILPEQVSWSNFARVLNSKFRSKIGVDLNDEQLTFLTQKAFRSANFQQKEITWSLVGKEKLHGCDFTFWQWFYACLELSRDYLDDLWKNQLVHGFITTASAEYKLKSTGVPGTFLLRFSNTTIGGIVIDYLDRTGNVIQIGPFTSESFQKLHIANSIIDYACLTTLFPDREKVEAFSQHKRSTLHIQKTTAKNPGYIPPEYRVQAIGPQDTLNNSNDTQTFCEANYIPVGYVSLPNSSHQSGSDDNGNNNGYWDGQSFPGTILQNHFHTAEHNSHNVSCGYGSAYNYANCTIPENNGQQICTVDFTEINLNSSLSYMEQ